MKVGGGFYSKQDQDCTSLETQVQVAIFDGNKSPMKSTPSTILGYVESIPALPSINFHRVVETWRSSTAKGLV
jgi:hypothetical protein